MSCVMILPISSRYTMRKLLFLVIVAMAAISSGCNGGNNDPDPYFNSNGNLSGSGGSFNNGAGF